MRSLQAHPWVEQRIEKVDDEVRDPNQQDVIDEHADRGRVVAAEDRLDQLTAESWNRKCLLDHQRARDQSGHDRPDDGQDGKRCVAKNVDAQDFRFIHAIGGAVVT